MNPNPPPFSRRAVLALVGLGTALFLALTYMVGAGLAHGPLNDGGSHGAGKGLTGYAALAALLERQGWQVAMARTPAELKQPGLLVLTPPAGAKGEDLARAVEARRHIGPTVVVTPKWLPVPLQNLQVPLKGARPGWVTLGGTALPGWKGFLDEIAIGTAPLPGGRWTADRAAGQLPDPRVVLSGRGERLVPLVEGAVPSGPILAGFIADGGHYPALDAMALVGSDPGDANSGVYPLVVVFEPDLIDNYGLSRSDNALYALRLFDAASGGMAPRSVTFDISFNGFARSPNLLTLAFTPPFLAATLCLLLAALIVGWRAFLRFGGGAAEAPIAFGKAALVANAGGLVRRSGRLHLLAAPYAAMVRDRLVRALGLPRHADGAASEAAIDRALAVRAPEARPFSVAAAALRAARRPIDLLRAAQDLHALERMLKE
ncbi:DUF4350 domain-containing protein [Novosphingobium flavum]|uniref:DUF4350 domain-containing protein n=1 Tax=Novosphingobium flavum TaxID=1778672 RepID=A0A7X1FP74_9SPHN|nr:DUF4350 domain-containing protein [Novosphingobium flavum]MBC2664344.1 DUF4350 domain-containing protein [Novosphingobium flavum]